MLVLSLMFVLTISAFAEDVKTASGEVVGTCSIESSETKYTSIGQEVVWVRVKVKNNTGNRIRGTVYGNNGGYYEFIIDPYDSSYGYLKNCHEEPTSLICNDAH